MQSKSVEKEYCNENTLFTDPPILQSVSLERKVYTADMFSASLKFNVQTGGNAARATTSNSVQPQTTSTPVANPPAGPATATPCAS